jgi:hypothetical protein
VLHDAGSHLKGDRFKVKVAGAAGSSPRFNGAFSVNPKGLGRSEEMACTWESINLTQFQFWLLLLEPFARLAGAIVAALMLRNDLRAPPKPQQPKDSIGWLRRFYTHFNW